MPYRCCDCREHFSVMTGTVNLGSCKLTHGGLKTCLEVGDDLAEHGHVLDGDALDRPVLRVHVGEDCLGNGPRQTRRRQAGAGRARGTRAMSRDDQARDAIRQLDAGLSVVERLTCRQPGPEPEEIRARIEIAKVHSDETWRRLEARRSARVQARRRRGRPPRGDLRAPQCPRRKGDGSCPASPRVGGQRALVRELQRPRAAPSASSSPLGESGQIRGEAKIAVETNSSAKMRYSMMEKRIQA